MSGFLRTIEMLTKEYTVASAPAVTSLVFMIQIMFGTVCLSMILFDNLHIYIILLFVVENMHKSVPSQFYSIHTVYT